MVKVRSLQLTRMFLRMSECRHCKGILYGGRDETLFSAPRQSETILTLPVSVGWTLFTLRSSRCMAISPRSSPQYAFATVSLSKNDPTIRPRPFAHSLTKAAEHRLGYNLRMYEPSVTATRDPSWMERCIHSVPPVTITCSHSHVFPHDSRTSRNVEGCLVLVDICVVDAIFVCAVEG